MCILFTYEKFVRLNIQLTFHLLYSPCKTRRSDIMYMISNAIKNIGRNKGRNILLAMILFVIIFTASVAITINSATSSIIDDYKSRFGSEVFLLLDSTKLKAGENPRNITQKEYLSFGESDHLQKKVFTGYNSLVITNGKGVGEEESNGEVQMDSAGEGEAKITAQPNMILMGYSDQNINDEFANGLRKIVEGKMASNNGEVIVSEKLASLNKWKVGSKIDMKTFTPKNVKLAVSDTVTISGIYRNNNTELQSYSAATNRNNEVITTLDIFMALKVNQAENPGAEQPYLSATYYLKDPKKLEAFQAELQAKGLPEYYMLSTNEESYNKIVAPVEGMKKITFIFMGVVLALGSAVLIMLSTLSIRERKYEVGVLRAMGMKKGKVAFGMFSEMIIITAACLVIGLGIGSVAAQPVANVLLDSQVAALKGNGSDENQNPNENNGGEYIAPGEMGSNPLSEMKISLTGKSIVEISFIALILAGISSIAGIVFITRYEPMKILSERN